MMTTNTLAIFDPAQLPAHVKAAREAGTTNIVTRGQGDTLTFAGKVWALNIDGVKTPLMKHNPDGEEELVQTFDAVIVAYNENRGRAYYSGTYDPQNESAPDCWSSDGIDSSPEAPARQSEKCNVCPMAVKGSRQTDAGVATTACGQHRNLAVIPLRRIGEFPLLRLKLAITSDFDGRDKDAQAKNLYAFKNYLDFLKSKRVPFTYSLATRIRFDSKVNYPKLLFSPSRWLTAEETAVCEELAASPDIEALLKTDYTGFQARPPGITEEDEEEEVPAAPAAVSKPSVGAGGGATAVGIQGGAPKPTVAATAPKPATTVVATGKAKMKKAAEAEAAAAARKAAALAEEDDDPLPGLDATPSPAAAHAAQMPSSSPALDSILKDWNDD